MPIDERMKKGITLHNVTIMSEISGLVLTVKDDEDAGAEVTIIRVSLLIIFKYFY